MPSQYLQGSDPALYGVPNATTAQIEVASTLIDGYLQRQEGLIWMPDANGNPAYMAALTSSLVLTTTQSLSPGQNVSVTVTGPLLAISTGSTQCGLVAIVDRTNSLACEAVIVTGITQATNTIQLQNVQFSHPSGTKLEFNLVIFEECQMPTARPITNLSRTPVQIVLAGQGRYGYARRGNAYYELTEYNLLAAITQFGGPPIWEIFDQTLVGIDPNKGQVWAPAGILLAYYTEIRFSYIAGWTYAGLPTSIKAACASIIAAGVNMPLNGAIQSYRAGDTQYTRFADTYFSQDTKALLEPYKSRYFI